VLPPDHTLPARDLSQYSVDGDPHSENDIRGYVHGQARDDTVQHVEKIKEEFVLGGKYEIWDVITEKDRYWVITNLTNLYSQKHFPSLDYTLSFHIGLMMRFRSRPETLRAMTRVLSMKYSAVKSRPRTETIEPLKLRTIKLWACISESPCFHWPER
jgi:hypothetical protein